MHEKNRDVVVGARAHAPREGGGELGGAAGAGAEAGVRAGALALTHTCEGFVFPTQFVSLFLPSSSIHPANLISKRYNFLFRLLSFPGEKERKKEGRKEGRKKEGSLFIPLSFAKFLKHP